MKVKNKLSSGCPIPSNLLSLHISCLAACKQGEIKYAALTNFTFDSNYSILRPYYSHCDAKSKASTLAGSILRDW